VGFQKFEVPLYIKDFHISDNVCDLHLMILWEVYNNRQRYKYTAETNYNPVINKKCW